MFDRPAIGVQRLALLAPDRRDAVLDQALASGVGLLDTADVYGGRLGEAERWLARVAGRVPVATKGGLRLEGTRMIPDGRPGALTEAAEQSRDRLQVDALALWQWHAPDPKVAPATSLKAIRRLVDRGVVRAVGLCNVTVGVLRAAADELPIACLQVELSPARPDSVRSGVIEEALRRGVPVLAYRPLGGVQGAKRLIRDPVLAGIAARSDLTPAEVVLAWLRSLGVIPLPGPTSAASVEGLRRARAAALDPADLERLDARFEPGRLRVPRDRRAPPADAAGEVVIVMGIPGAGKSTAVARYPDHVRLNRDERGGRLADLLKPLGDAVARGDRVVLDNTYASRASRNRVIEAAWAHGVPVRCEWLDTPPDEAEVNVVLRALDLLGRLPTPEELTDPPVVGIIPPMALTRYRAEHEDPEPGEGFTRVDRVPFVRRPWPGAGRAVVLDPRDLVPANAERLAAFAADGHHLVVIGWDPGVPEAHAVEGVRARGRALGLEVHAGSCPHPAGPPRCWCRKPLPGLAVRLLRELRVDPSRSVAWGGSPADRSVARKLGIPLLT